MPNCLNCEYSIDKNEKFCAQCGQKTKIGPLNFFVIVKDFFTNLFNIEAKIWQTLRDIWIPGKLTLAFVDGKRQQYYNPIRIFLVVLFAMFAVFFSLLNSSLSSVAEFGKSQEKKIWSKNLEARFDSLTVGTEMFPDSLIKFKMDLFEITAIDYEKSKMTDETADVFGDLMAEKPIYYSTRVNHLLDSLIDIQANRVDTLTISADTVAEKGLPAINFSGNDREGINMRVMNIEEEDLYTMSEEELVKKYGGKRWANDMMIIQAQKIVKDLSASVKFLIGNGTWAIIAMVLLLACLFKLLYIRNKNHRFAEHFIFHLYGHTRFHLICIFFMLVVLVFKISSPSILLLTLIGAVYLFVDMKKYYGQSFGKTMLKYFATLCCYLCFMCACATLIFLLSLAFF